MDSININNKICSNQGNGTGHYWLQVAGEVWRCKKCKHWTLLPISFEVWKGVGNGKIVDRKLNEVIRSRYHKVSKYRTQEMKDIINSRRSYDRRK